MKSRIRLSIMLLVFTIFGVAIAITPAHAATYSQLMGTGRPELYQYCPMQVSGYNITQGFSQVLPSSYSFSGGGDDRQHFINFTLPNDGSTWAVVGMYSLTTHTFDPLNGGYSTATTYGTFNQTITTPGTFTGVSIGQAVNAANSASTYASQAKTSADNASAQAAAANTAATNAASNTEDAEGTAIEGIRDLADVSNTILNNINNITNNVAPVINSVRGLFGATCTINSEFTVTISSNPNSGVTYRVRCGEFDSGWVGTNTITITGLNTIGPHQAICEVKNNAGVTSQEILTVFRL